MYEVDPLICPKCGGTMRIASFITEPDVIDRILSHRGEFEERTHSPPEEEDQAVELTYEPCYDDLPINEIL